MKKVLAMVLILMLLFIPCLDEDEAIQIILNETGADNVIFPAYTLVFIDEYVFELKRDEGVHRYTPAQISELSEAYNNGKLEKLPPLTAKLMKELPDEVPYEYMMQNYEFFADICERWAAEKIGMHFGPGIAMMKADLLLEVYFEETQFGYVYEEK